MKIKLDDKNSIEIKKEEYKDFARLTIRSRQGREVTIVSAILNDDQVEKMIKELVSIKAKI